MKKFKKRKFLLLVFLIFSFITFCASRIIPNKPIRVEGNTNIKKFSSAKRKLSKIYEKLDKKTFYCSCIYEKAGKNGTTKENLKKCGYDRSKGLKDRDFTIEWEHIVPANIFGGHLSEWKEGLAGKCYKTEAKQLSGRECAKEYNELFNYMEADLYNLVPAIGMVNGIRSNYDIALIEGEERKFGKCDIEMDKKLVEPPSYVRGDMARVYMYMQKAYLNSKIITEKNEVLIKEWNKKDPVSKEECKAYFAKKEVQKNINPILEKPCLQKFPLY